MNAPPNAPTGLPTVDEIRDTVRTVLSGEAYDLDPKTTSTTNPIAEAIAWLQEKIERLLDLISFEPNLAPGSGVISEGPLRVLAAVALLALVAVLAHLLWRVYRDGVRRPKTDDDEPEEEPPPADELAERAQALAQDGRYADASRVLYRAALTRLEEARGGRFQSGLTNTEYLRTFRAPWVLESLRVFVDLINWKWYRDNRIDLDDYRRCEEAYRRLDVRLRETG